MRGKIPTYQTGINTCSTDKRFLKEWVTLVCKILDHSTISIHILAGKIQNCLAFRADPKMSDLDALIGL